MPSPAESLTGADGGGVGAPAARGDLVLTPERLRVVRDGAVAIVAAPAVFRVEGPGALPCLQGLLTNDLAKPGDHSLVYGALLTPKGMVVVDFWVLREPDGFTLVAPAQAREASLELFRKSLPPRLAAVTDRTGEWHALWCVGAQGFATLARAGLGTLPEACGRTTRLALAAGPLALALGTDRAYFAALAVGAPTAVEAAAAALARGGAAAGGAEDLAAARVLAGWPALGAEIDERTLPQEVRYDELGGVSYTKGCYTGQETVARLHFRGHTNRELRGLCWPGGWRPRAGDDRAVIRAGREVGTVRSTLSVGDRTIGLAPIRREVAVGDEVVAGGAPARVVRLPFAPADLEG
jgi:folate-binding protein YgfZ